LNLAFYEVLGKKGWETLEKTIALIPGDVLKIGDGKRGDIGNTAEMYARALFDELRFDAATVNPYMGSDSVEPFLRNPRKGAFVLTLTSNTGARDFQYRRSDGRPLYEYVVAKVSRWNKSENCGLVVGATRPAELKHLRELAPHIPFLIPGVGAQGGSMKAAVKFGCTSSGDLAIINVGRSILYASSGKDFALAARKEATRLRDEMNWYRTM
jgi:orotidine-5'-phosphate decarboxylase